MKTIKLLFCFSLFIFSFSFCHGQSWLWARQGTNESDTWGIATDAKGNAYLSGYFWDSITFGNKHLISPNIDSYLVKYDSLGNMLWVAQSKAATNLSGAAAIFAATDNFGNTYLTGSFDDTVSFGAFTLKSFYYLANNGGDVFLTKYNASGNVVWAKEASVPSAASYSYTSSITTDASGNVYITGYFRDTITFGAYTLKSMHANGGLYLAKYDSAGNVLWAKQSTASSANDHISSYSIATDKASNTYMTGSFIDTITLGSYTLSNKSNYGNTYLAKYDPNGLVLWFKQVTIPNKVCTGSGYSVATDKEGNACLTGYFWDTAVFGSFTLTTNSQHNSDEIFIAKYSPTGTVLWAKQSGNNNKSNPWLGYSVSVDTMDDIYLSGGDGSGGTGKVWYQKDTFSYSGTSDPSLILKLDSSGNLLCSSFLNSGGDDFNAIAACPSGKFVYFGGDVETSIVLGKDTLSPTKLGESPFIARWQACYINTASINEISSQKSSTILYPNPNKGVFTLALSHPELVSGSQTIEIYNMLGQQVYNAMLKQVQHDYEMSLSNQPDGVYLYRVISQTGELVGDGKFVIEK